MKTLSEKYDLQIIFQTGKKKYDDVYFKLKEFYPDFEKDKNQNKLNDAHIEKIISAYKARQDIEKYAHVASIEEIRENDFNLNIPRYVDTFEEEEQIDLNLVLQQLAEDNREIAKLEQEIHEQLRLLGVKI